MLHCSATVRTLVVTKYKVKIISKRMCLLCINFRKVSKLKKKSVLYTAQQWTIMSVVSL